jgi:GT2 family glycosyltransferase
METKPKVSIVMVPRERFSLTRDCLEHIYSFTEEPFELVLMDLGCPAEMVEKMKAWESSHPNMKIVRTEKYIYPYEAKNIALKHISPDTEWVVFVDSDVMVYPHWLTKMLEAANETGARVIHPLYLFEFQNEVTIHMADGILKPFKRNGKTEYQGVMNLVGMRMTLFPKLVRKESDFLEFHVFMIRRDLLKEMGEFEPISLAEDVNWSLRLHEFKKDEKIIFEPASIIKYIAGPPFKKCDLPYFRFRWSSEAIERSIVFLRKRWPQIMPSYWDGKVKWAYFHAGRVNPLFIPKQQWNRFRNETSQLLVRARRKAGRLMGV